MQGMVTRTEILSKENQEKNRKIIEEAAALVRAGELVAFPTETVYGLGADALQPEGAKKIYAAKGRPSDNPLIVHIADVSSLRTITKHLPPQAGLLAQTFWPGPLTMIFEKSASVPYETTGGLDTVAVRMPAHPAALSLIRASGGYIAAPSANTSGRPSPTLARHVEEDLGGKIPMILDGGPVGIGIESTILDLTPLSNGEQPMILRPGYITAAMLANVIGPVQDDPALTSVDPDAKPKAPGMKYRHYAPKAQLIIVSGNVSRVTETINALSSENHKKNRSTGVICTDETAPLYHADYVQSIGSRQDEDSIARHLYAILREFDELGADQIYSENFSTPRIGAAIMNRLLKAAGHQVLEV